MPPEGAPARSAGRTTRADDDHDAPAQQREGVRVGLGGHPEPRRCVGPGTTPGCPRPHPVAEAVGGARPAPSGHHPLSRTLRDHAVTSAGVRWTGVRVVLWMDRRRRRCPWGTSPAHVGEARRERSATRCGSHRSWEATTTARGSPGRRHGVGREEISSSRGGRRTGPGSCPCGARTLRGVWPLRRRPRHAAR